MRGIFLAMIAAVGLALATAPSGAATPVGGAAIRDAASAIALAEQVHCRWDGAYHCHSYGCHYGCGVRRYRYYSAPRLYYAPRYRYRSHRFYRRW